MFFLRHWDIKTAGSNTRHVPGNKFVKNTISTFFVRPHLHFSFDSGRSIWVHKEIAARSLWRDVYIYGQKQLFRTNCSSPCAMKRITWWFCPMIFASSPRRSAGLWDKSWYIIYEEWFVLSLYSSKLLHLRSVCHKKYMMRKCNSCTWAIVLQFVGEFHGNSLS